MGTSQPPGDVGAATPKPSHPAEGTVVFVDLAGFTALTDSHGDSEAVAIIDRFEAAVRAALDDPTTLIKFIGDEAMLTFDGPDDAIAAVRIIVARCQRDGFPELRVGLHHGPLTWRGDDPFGATVNLASRIASHAAGGQVLASITVARALAEGETTPAGEFAARGVTDPIELVEVATAATPSSIDPVCQMQITRGHGVASIVYAATRWDLCSLACARRFAADPELYLAQLRQPVPNAARRPAAAPPAGSERAQDIG